MKLHFANTNFPDAAGAKRLALAAEAAGFKSVVVVEHVVWPTTYASRCPYAPSGRLPGGPETNLPDPLIWIAFAAAVTTRLRFLTGILILPQWTLERALAKLGRDSHATRSPR